MVTAERSAAYLAHKERARERQADMSRRGRDIGNVPAIVDPARKSAAVASFRVFLDTYFPTLFYLGWSNDHLTAIARIEQAVVQGGLFAFAMPRGSGKTTLSELGVLWAILTGRREFVALVGSDEGHAADMLDHVKIELETNDLLFEDFPEVCHPVRSLEGIAQRASGQHIAGERTHVEWTAKYIVLPTVEGSKASGAIIRVAGLTGRIRGMNHKRPDGRTVRPSLVVLDDPQTDESARSASQCANRERIVAGAILGLAGPGKKIAGVMPCTVIAPGDMADRILDREKHPEWQGERTKLCYAFPTAKELWDQYAKIREAELRAGRTIAKATEFYRKNRVAMDAGAVVAWPERYNREDEISAVQHVMNLLLQDVQAFHAEYQNEPLHEQVGDVRELSVEEIARKLNGQARREIDESRTIVTAFVDVQQSLLYWLVCAWSEDFTGQIVDYGAWPDQRKSYFTLRDAKRTLQTAYPKAGIEGAIRQGLADLTEHLFEKVAWVRDDGAPLWIDRLLIDANWDVSTEVVKQFCKESAHAANLTPSHGRFVGATGKPMNDHEKKPGERVGNNWRMPKLRGKLVRHVAFDTNYWKSFVHARLAVSMGDRGSLTLFKPGRGESHAMLAEHLTAEYRVRAEARNRTVDEWKLRPEKPDNHFFDCLVGCAVGASMQGAALAEVSEAGRPTKRARQKMKLSSMQGRR